MAKGPVVLVLLLAAAAAATTSASCCYVSTSTKNKKTSTRLHQSLSQKEAEFWGKTPKQDFRGGAGVGRLVLDERASQPDAWKCKYDMILVERIQDDGTRPRGGDADGEGGGGAGLYVPRENLPKFHLCRVLSVGTGREEENGRVTPMPPNVKVGDVIVAKNPWGIGPKDEETADGKKLSFMRAQDVAAVITGGLAD